MVSTNQIAGFFKMQYIKKEMNEEVCFWNADKNLSFLQVDHQIKSLHIFAIFPEKCG